MSVGVWAADTYLRAERFQAHPSACLDAKKTHRSPDFFILVVIGDLIVADKIHDSGRGNRCLELVRLRDEPFGELAAVADAFDAHALAVDPEISPHCRANTVLTHPGLRSVLVAEDRISEFLSISRRTSEVHVQHRVAMRRKDLIAKIESRAVLSMGAAVNIHNERVL